MFTGTEWTTVGTGAGVAAAVLGFGKVLWGDFKKKDPALANKIQHDIPSALLTGLTDAGKFVRNLFELPLFAGLAAKGKVEATHVHDLLVNAELRNAITTVLAAAQSTWGQMGEIEKGTLITEVQAAMSKLGVTVAAAQVTGLVEQVVTAIGQAAPSMKDAKDRAAAITGGTKTK